MQRGLAVAVPQPLATVQRRPGEPQRLSQLPAGAMRQSEIVGRGNARTEIVDLDGVIEAVLQVRHGRRVVPRVRGQQPEQVVRLGQCPPVVGPLREGTGRGRELGPAGRLTLSTGVMVLYADEESFTLMTPQGHMFAGWITFSAVPAGDDGVMAQVQVLLRASDPIFELGLMLGGHAQEDRFWQETLTRLAAAHGLPAASVQTTVVCVDRKRQWSKWRNVWHSSAIRSSVYTLGAPVRLVRGKLRRTPETPAVP